MKVRRHVVFIHDFKFLFIRALAALAATILFFELTSIEKPISESAVHHELQSSKHTFAQQLLDLNCGLPQLHEAREFTSSEYNDRIASLGIHFGLILPQNTPCPTNIPAKYACSVEAAVRTETPVRVWIMHESLLCPVVQWKGYTLEPLVVDDNSILGQWHHEHRQDLWNEGYRTSFSLISNFVRLYLLRRGGGTWLDLDVHVLKPTLFNRLPESVAAQERPTALKFRGIHRYNGAYLRFLNTSTFLEKMEADWVTSWAFKGNHRGYTGPAAVTRVLNQMMAEGNCKMEGRTVLLNMESVYGVKVGDEDIIDAAAFHSKLDFWLVDGKPLGRKRELEVKRACPKTWQQKQKEQRTKVMKNGFGI